MSATVDANVLVYASDSRAEAHEQAEALVRRLAAGPEILYLFWPVLLGYLRIVTHPGILTNPLSPADASSRSWTDLTFERPASSTVSGRSSGRPPAIDHEETMSPTRTWRR